MERRSRVFRRPEARRSMPALLRREFARDFVRQPQRPLRIVEVVGFGALHPAIRGDECAIKRSACDAERRVTHHRGALGSEDGTRVLGCLRRWCGWRWCGRRRRRRSGDRNGRRCCGRRRFVGRITRRRVEGSRDEKRQAQHDEKHGFARLPAAPACPPPAGQRADPENRANGEERRSCGHALL